MPFQRDNDASPDPLESGLPAAQSGQDVPRWLVVLGAAAALTLLVALLRYAIDLLGVVFVIILVGFALRALSDWLTEGESVSGWAVSALSVGLMGTALVGVWLFNSSDLTGPALGQHLPGPVQRTVLWLEEHGWGQRVLLPATGGGGGLGIRAGSAPGVSEQGEGSGPAPVAMAPMTPPVLPAPAPSAPAPRASRPGAPRTPAGAAEAAEHRPAEPAIRSEPAAPVARAATQVTLAVPSTSVVGRAVRLLADVRATGADSAPTGDVEFFAGQTSIGRAPLRRGTALLVTLRLQIGTHVLTAAYHGDETHLPSRSAGVAHAVTRQ